MKFRKQKVRQARQGDVFFSRVVDLPSRRKLQAVCPEEGRIVLARGEKQNHAHVITETKKVEAWFDGDRLYLSVGGKVSVTHEEHKAITLERGKWEVTKQKDTFPDGTTSPFVGD